MISGIRHIIASKYGLMGLVLLANIVFMTVMAVALPIGYEENDDVMMCMIANGSYSGTPDYHLVYINVLYGMVLVWLYGLTKAIEWYTLSFVVLHVVSMTVLVYCILTMCNRAWWERILWLLALYVLWARIIVALQFTTTAGLVCLAGCVLLMRESAKSRWTGVALIVIAALIRFMAAGLVGVLMAPIIVYTLRLEWRRYIPIVVMLVLVVGCRVANGYVYNSSPEWRYYREYNQLRAQLNDNPNAYHLYVNQLPEGVDKEDYKLLMNFTPDPEQIDLVRIRQLQAMVENMPYARQWRNLHRLDKYAVEIGILIALLVLMVLTTGNRTKYIFLILYSAFVVALVVHVSLDGFLKNRVFLCMLLPMLMTDFYLLPNTTGMKRKYALCVAMAMLSGWYVWQTNQDIISSKSIRYAWNRLQLPLMEHVPDNGCLINIGATAMTQGMNPFRISMPVNRYGAGWLTAIPFNKTKLQSFRELCHPDKYIMVNRNYREEESRMQTVRRQMEHDYGLRTCVVPICHNGAYAIVQLQPVGDSKRVENTIK